MPRKSGTDNLPVSEGGGFWAVGRQGLNGDGSPDSGAVGPAMAVRSLDTGDEAQGWDEGSEGLHVDGERMCGL